jgi:sulfite reductase (ferredoxin)
MLLGGHVGQTQIEFGQKALRLPAKNVPKAVVAVVERFVGEREAGETFTAWLERSGGPKAIGAELAELDRFPTPDEAPDFYVDYGETGPYAAVTGASECAT